MGLFGKHERRKQDYVKETPGRKRRAPRENVGNRDILMKGFSQLSGNIVIPMTADCADYEVYRSGRYVPGLMGTLFSFVDKLISSLSTTLVAMIYAAIGYTSTLPTQEDPYTTGVLVCTIACFLGMPAIGWILNVVAMKFYPLTKERMAEIQGEVSRIKAQAQKSA